MLLRLLAIFLLISAPAFARERSVAVSIKPIHSLVENITRGTTIRPYLLLDKAVSLHEANLRPSQAQKLQESEVVIYIHPSLEASISAHLKHTTHRQIILADTPGLTLYPPRFSAYDEGDDEHRGGGDLHLWTSPENARLMAAYIASRLIEIYPDQEKQLRANEKALDEKLQKLDAEIALHMQKLKDRKFSTFHDATQYFERRYGLESIGSLTFHPERGLSAGHVQKLRAEMHGQQVACIFTEPGFDMRMMNNLVKDTGAKTAVLDAEAIAIAPGPDLYFDLIRGIASQMESCLN